MLDSDNWAAGLGLPKSGQPAKLIIVVKNGITVLDDLVSKLRTDCVRVAADMSPTSAAALTMGSTSGGDLYSEKALVATFNDLDHMFESDSESSDADAVSLLHARSPFSAFVCIQVAVPRHVFGESEMQMNCSHSCIVCAVQFQVPTPPGGPRLTDDGVKPPMKGSSLASCTVPDTGGPTNHDLSRMYPTPPSHENQHSPIAGRLW